MIQPFATPGSHPVLRSGCDARLESTIKNRGFRAPLAVASGCVSVESSCFLCSNRTIQHGMTVARGCEVGAGRTITHNTQGKGAHPALPTRLLPTMGDRTSEALYRRMRACDVGLLSYGSGI